MFARLMSLFYGFLTFGTATAAREVAARMTASTMKADQEATQVAAENLRLAEGFADSGPHQRRIAELLQEATVRNFAALQAVSNGTLSLGEGQEALATNPFSANSDGSAQRSLEAQKSLEKGPEPTNGQTSTEPIRRRRGRPSKNRPDSASPGTPSEGSNP